MRKENGEANGIEIDTLNSTEKNYNFHLNEREKIQF
jgi:hypothetical protein